MKVHSLTFSYIPRSIRCDSHASFLARTLASCCLGHEPKVKVVTFMNQGEKFCGLGIFVKFGSRTAFHHNVPMPLETLSLLVIFSTMAIASLSFPNLDGQDLPLQTIGDAI